MQYGAIDLHKQFSQIRIVDARRAPFIRERRVRTSGLVLFAGLRGPRFGTHSLEAGPRM